MNKVQGGTPQHTESRCLTCRAAQIVRGLADSSERVYCKAFNLPPIMAQPVIQCNVYDDKRMPSRYDMEQIAWVLITNKAGKAIGFASAEDFRKQNGYGQPTAPIGF